MPRLLLLIACLSVPFLAGAQVVHNFEMGPENTDCARLDSLSLPEAQFADSVLASTFRLREELEISRYSAPRKLLYVSCDGASGYLLVWHDEAQIQVYKGARTADWESILEAKDPREVLQTVTKKLQRYGDEIKQ